MKRILVAMLTALVLMTAVVGVASASQQPIVRTMSQLPIVR